MRELRAKGRQELELEIDARVETLALPEDGARLVRELVEQELSGRLDHRGLSGREAEGQHPVAAIEGLKDELERIPAPAEAMTNFELEELLK